LLIEYGAFAEVREDLLVVREDLLVVREDLLVVREDLLVVRGDLLVVRGDLAVARGDLALVRGDLGVPWEAWVAQYNFFELLKKYLFNLFHSKYTQYDANSIAVHKFLKTLDPAETKTNNKISYRLWHCK
jgi:hypothetical protein